MFSHHSSIFFPEIQAVMRFSQFNTRPGNNFKVNKLSKHLYVQRPSVKILVKYGVFQVL